MAKKKPKRTPAKAKLVKREWRILWYGGTPDASFGPSTFATKAAAEERRLMVDENSNDGEVVHVEVKVI